MRAATGLLSLVVVAVVSIGTSASAVPVTIDWTLIGNPGNACDPESQGCFGAVGYGYDIGTYEVTNTQYAEFLNAVADTDANGLYYTGMGSVASYGGITRSGSSGSYTYAVIAGRGDMPVNWTSAYDALRFANWLQNGQPNTGSQTAATTEDGAYTFSGPTTVGARNSGATIVLASEDEWYKAAYYNALSTSYFDYPAGSNTQTTCATPTATANRANCDPGGPGDVAIKGSYTGSASPYGTFDQGGNVFETTDTYITSSGPGYVQRGGSFGYPATELNASTRYVTAPQGRDYIRGFRVAMVPEPDTGLLLMIGLLGVASWRRRD
jgi:formylglycine-generating enzyme required for sulfatase activity